MLSISVSPHSNFKPVYRLLRDLDKGQAVGGDASLLLLSVLQSVITN
jgi:hypothetical protein